MPSARQTKRSTPNVKEIIFTLPVNEISPPKFLTHTFEPSGFSDVFCVFSWPTIDPLLQRRVAGSNFPIGSGHASKKLLMPSSLPFLSIVEAAANVIFIVQLSIPPIRASTPSHPMFAPSVRPTSFAKPSLESLLAQSITRAYETQRKLTSLRTTRCRQTRWSAVPNALNISQT